MQNVQREATPAILVENLTYRYDNLTAVDTISFQVAEGEVLGFLGPNGAGKSTTVKMLTGQLRPVEGRATLLGIDISKHASKVQAQIGVAFETSNLYEQMTGVENLILFARLFGVKGFDARALLEKVGLGERGSERVACYSKGMKQRLMIARALVNRPRILFLDEPTDGLDPVSSETIRGIIRDESQRGTTIFLTTHDMLEADKLSNRVAFINKGQIVALDTPHVLKQQFGKRALKVEIACPDGRLETRSVPLDQADTPQAVQNLFAQERVVTIHSEEATLEDIFIHITGRGLN
jgi:ABC-2 type transport system ATP-binding protein